MSAAAFYLPVGFSWSFPLTYTAGGVPFDFTGSTQNQATLYIRGVQTPIVLQPTSLAAKSGQATFKVGQDVTSGIAPDVYDACYPKPLLTRLVWSFTDSLGNPDVLGIFPIFVYDPRTIDPAAFPQDQTGTVAMSGVSAAQVAAMIAAAIAALQSPASGS